jgi:3-oxoacyl-[acyl-carrier-protein] synthase II
MSNRRVVVTGLGTVNPTGLTVKDSWHNLINSKSGISKIQSFDTTNFETKIAGEIKSKDIGGDFDPLNYVEFKEIKKMSKYCIYGMAAAQEAIKDAGIETDNEEELEKIGVLIGSGIGGIEAIAKNTLKLYGHELVLFSCHLF